MSIKEADKGLSRHLSLYTYDLSNKKNADKVRFVYTLKGRNGENGLVEQFKGKFLAPGCFIIPIKKDGEMKDILARWKVNSKRMEIMTR